ncbi:MAG: hypothetical protein J6A89_08550 [Clostridia bacterium]|nr:hypothetical protein [Clostridia bacterium]
MKYISKITKLIIMMITIILMTGCTTERENNTGGNTYKVAGDEYHNYIRETVETVIDKNSEYSLVNIISDYPFIQIYINYNNKIDETSFDNKNNEIAEQLFNELKKSNFKGNIGYEYNIISLNFKGIKSNCSEIICEMNKYVQIDVLEISDYETYSEYNNKQ